MKEKLSCVCGRSIPVIAVWTALSRARPLRCSDCGATVTRQSLLDKADGGSVYGRVVFALYRQLMTFGWTSASAITNAVPQADDGQAIGGLLAGLVRAGLIQRGDPPPSASSVHVGLVTPPSSPVFVPGTTFPIQEDENANR